MTDLKETIIAVSSAPGAGARAVVRLSGADVLTAVRGVFFAEPPIERERCRREGEIRLPDVHSPLPADLYLWLGPDSYTGQDVAEFHVLSSPPLVELLVSRLLSLGARAARPGELTMRGFLAGKLDLTRAEAVLAVIEAGSRSELQQALAQLAGGVTEPLRQLREDLLNLRADVEAGLDFADEDITFVAGDELLKRLARALALVTNLRRQVEDRGIGERPFRVVLAGRPNAGKSSLFNALTAGQALVSPEPGTTRDYLVGRLEVGGVVLELVDTAGWQATRDAIEQQAKQLGRSQAAAADLVLLCVPGSETLLPDEGWLLSGKTAVVLLSTKADIVDPSEGRLATSAVTGAGLDALREMLARRARAWAKPALAPSLSRCRHHVAVCLDHLRRAHAVALFGDPPEILAMELRGALEQLGEMAGAVYTDDLLDRIFSRFCIGK